MIEWKTSNTPIDYPQALEAMERRVAEIAAGRAPEMVWLLEHPPLYTAGTSARNEDLLEAGRFPVYKTGRGGEYTYHGPGQRIAYVMLDLKKRNAMDVRGYVRNLESWIIATLAEYGVTGERREGRIGIWVKKPDGCEAKIAALGIRIRKWVTYHGIAINVAPDLSHFSGIVPCGIREYGITSLKDLSKDITLDKLDKILKNKFNTEF